uniref:Uncharacterized protein n=1 Tax=Candidatus Kentrum sp. FM TaxID=2126340 RepID=A0A450TXG1_9GAMM|nr:MAG: hypothetical protein BECKFM1743A_GA0114220_107511 [Candidatus Kentron sp. FM]
MYARRAYSTLQKGVQSESDLATKADLRALENRIVYRMTLQMGGMFIANIVVLTGLV